jgi:hypothetical protein
VKSEEPEKPAFITTEVFEMLHRAIADSAVEILDGLEHTAPDEKAPDVVGERVDRFLCSRPNGRGLERSRTKP